MLGHLEALSEPCHLAVAGAEADHHDPQRFEVAQERRCADERVEILRMADVARVHDDEPIVELVLGRPGVRARPGGQLGGVHPVRDHRDAIGGSAFLLEPLLHRVADRHDAVGAAQVERHEPAERTEDERLLEPLDTLGDLREHVLADDEERNPEATRDDEPDVADDRRVGHAEHEVGSRAAERSEHRVAEVARVVGGAEVDLRALVRRRSDADDAHAVPRLLARQLVAAEVAGHHGHVVVARERLAELREQLRRRLDSGPVVLVEDEDPGARRRGHSTADASERSST